MSLLTDEIVLVTPNLYKTEDTPLDEKIVTARFYFPAGAGVWYLMELSEDKDLAFGLCNIFVKELGYFSINELEEIKVGGFKVQRDKDFKPCKYKDLKDKI